MPREVLDRIFEITRSPSNCNVQPWKVYIATGALRIVCGIRWLLTPPPGYRLILIMSIGAISSMSMKAAVECAVALYSNMGIERGDKEEECALSCGILNSSTRRIAFIGMDQKFGTTVAIDVGM